MERECVSSRKAEGVVKVYGGVPGHMVWRDRELLKPTHPLQSSRRLPVCSAGDSGADLTSSCVCLPVHSGVQCMLLCQRDTKKTGHPVHPIGSSCENGLILRPVRHGPPGDWVGRHCLAKYPDILP